MMICLKSGTSGRVVGEGSGVEVGEGNSVDVAVGSGEELGLIVPVAGRLVGCKGVHAARPAIRRQQ